MHPKISVLKAEGDHCESYLSLIIIQLVSECLVVSRAVYAGRYPIAVHHRSYPDMLFPKQAAVIRGKYTPMAVFPASKHT